MILQKAGFMPVRRVTSATNVSASPHLPSTNHPDGDQNGTLPSLNPDRLRNAQRDTNPPKEHQAELKRTRQEINATVKDDWDWPIPYRRPLSDVLHSLDNVAEWRERDSDSSYSPPSPIIPTDSSGLDSLESLTESMLSRSCKRREALRQEMVWNEGLRTYVERRDAWAGARKRNISPAKGALTNPHQSPSTSPTSPLRPSSPITFLPLVPPILPPTNQFRELIKPSTWPLIYAQVIIKGLTPNIPINLKDIVNALVQGWKKDGEWPPKSEAEKTSAAKIGVDGYGDGRMAVKKGVVRVKKALGLGGGIDAPGRGEGRLA